MLQNPGHAHGCVGNVLDKRERQSDFLSQGWGAASNPQTPLPAGQGLLRLRVPDGVCRANGEVGSAEVLRSIWSD